MKDVFSVFPSGLYSVVIVEAEHNCDYVQVKLPNNYCAMVNVHAAVDAQTVLLFRDHLHELVVEWRPVRTRRRSTDVPPEPPLVIPDET